MIRRIFLCRATGTDPHENLALEQYLLEHVEPESCILYLWQNRHTVVLGRNQNAWQECRCAQLEADGGFLARRLSGGGAVFHDLGNLNFTFLVPTQDYDLERQLSVVAQACLGLGLSVERSGRNDVLCQGRKFSGNAFYSHQGKSYHHGTLLVDVDLEAMGRYLSPSPAKLQAKGVASVRSRVVNLKQLCPQLTVEEMGRQMELAFGQVYGLPVEIMDPRQLDAQAIQALTEHNRSWSWLYGRKLPFTLQCAQKFDWGELTVQLKADEGVIQEALVETIGCSGMTHSAAMASEILIGKTILEALNTDLVCDAINTAMRELFLQIVYGRTQSAFSEDGLAVGASLEDLGKGLRSQIGTMFGTVAKGPRYLEMAEGYCTRMALNAQDEIIGYEFVNLGKMMDFIKKGDDANTALEKAKGHYGQWDSAAKYIDPRQE